MVNKHTYYLGGGRQAQREWAAAKASPYTHVHIVGGGGAVDLKLYGSVQAQHNVPSFPGRRLAADPVEATRHEEAVSIGGAAEQGPATRGPSRHATQGAEAPGTTSTSAKPPPASDAAVRARWLVANSLWSAVSTVSVRPVSGGTHRAHGE